MTEVPSSAETTAVVEPPVAAYVAPPPADPPTYLPPPFAAPSPGRTSAPVGWVIAAMLLFWPTGIPALLASHRAAHAFGAADVVTATRESARARRWSIASVVVGGVLIVLSVLTTIAWAVVVAVAVHDHHDVGFDRGPRFDNQQPFGAPNGPSHRRSNG